MEAGKRKRRKRRRRRRRSHSHGDEDLQEEKAQKISFFFNCYKTQKTEQLGRLGIRVRVRVRARARVRVRVRAMARVEGLLCFMDFGKLELCLAC
jgi:hypothetical protein